MPNGFYFSPIWLFLKEWTRMRWWTKIGRFELCRPHEICRHKRESKKDYLYLIFTMCPRAVGKLFGCNGALEPITAKRDLKLFDLTEGRQRRHSNGEEVNNFTKRASSLLRFLFNLLFWGNSFDCETLFNSCESHQRNFLFQWSRNIIRKSDSPWSVKIQIFTQRESERDLHLHGI